MIDEKMQNEWLRERIDKLIHYMKKNAKPEIKEVYEHEEFLPEVSHPRTARDMHQEPVLGMGLTKLMWSDRHPYTVIEIKSANRIIVQEDEHIRVDSNGMSDSQEYLYLRNTNGAKEELIKTKRGWKVIGQKTYFALGYRREYYDYSF